MFIIDKNITFNILTFTFVFITGSANIMNFRFYCKVYL